MDQQQKYQESLEDMGELHLTYQNSWGFPVGYGFIFGIWWNILTRDRTGEFPTGWILTHRLLDIVFVCFCCRVGISDPKDPGVPPVGNWIINPPKGERDEGCVQGITNMVSKNMNTMNTFVQYALDCMLFLTFPGVSHVLFTWGFIRRSHGDSYLHYTYTICI